MEIKKKRGFREDVKEMIEELIEDVEDKDVFIRKSCLLDFFKDYLGDEETDKDGAVAYLSPGTCCWLTIKEIKDGKLCDVTKNWLSDEMGRAVESGAIVPRVVSKGPALRV